MKTLTKKTYNLPADVVAEFEKQVAPGKRGAVLGNAMARWLEEKRRTELRAAIQAGLADKENEALYLEVEREWAPVSDELWAQLPDEDWPEPTVIFPEGYAAYEAQHEK